MFAPIPTSALVLKDDAPDQHIPLPPTYRPTPIAWVDHTMIGVILNLALRDNTPPPAELHYTHLVNAHTSALTALAQARRDPQTPARTIAALERMVADYEGILRKLQSKRPEFSIGMVTQLTTWGTTDLTF